MVGWHHQLNGNEFEQAPEDREGQGSLMCCSPWDVKEPDMTEKLNNNVGAAYTTSSQQGKIRGLECHVLCLFWFQWNFLLHQDAADSSPA